MRWRLDHVWWNKVFLAIRGGFNGKTMRDVVEWYSLHAWGLTINGCWGEDAIMRLAQARGGKFALTGIRFVLVDKVTWLCWWQFFCLSLIAAHTPTCLSSNSIEPLQLMWFSVILRIRDHVKSVNWPSIRKTGWFNCPQTHRDYPKP